MSYFTDIIRESRQRVAAPQDGGSARWGETAEGLSGPEQDCVADRLAEESHLDAARFSPSRPGLRPADNGGSTRVEEALQEFGSEGPVREAAMESAVHAPPARGTEQIAPGFPAASNSGPARKGGPPVLHRMPAESRSAAAEGPASSGRGRIPAFPEEPAAHLREPAPREAGAASPAITEAHGAGSPVHAKAVRPSGSPVDRSRHESGPYETSAHSVAADAVSAEGPTAESGPPARRRASERVAGAKPTTVVAASPPMATASPRGETRAGSLPPQVRIGQVNVIVESDRTAREQKSPSSPAENLASRTFLRSL